MDELKQKIEALLFSSGRKMPVDEIARLCHKHTDKVEEALRELKKESGVDDGVRTRDFRSHSPALYH